MKKFGFTLAEVLITLTIIGVIAALTIPTLIGKYEKHQTVVALKKAYSEVNQAIELSIAENGSVKDWDWTQQDEAWVNKYFIPYFKIVETTTMQEAKKRVGGNYYGPNGKAQTAFGILRPLWPAKVITLPSGEQIWLEYNLGSWARQFAYTIWVDINGYKKPNMIGKDVFIMNLLRNEGKLYMNNLKTGDTSYVVRSRQELLETTGYGCNKQADGDWCGALIQYDNWEIKDDYPW